MDQHHSEMNKYSDSILQERARVAETGDLRERVRFDLTTRAPYAFGLLAAADAASYFGFTAVTAIEFGVADGAGLLDLCALAAEITELTGIAFQIYGFDTGSGLPALRDFRDHPEIWTPGDFACSDRAALEARLPAGAAVVWGEVADTLGPFVEQLTDEAPVGFVVHDMDIYHSTAAALELYRADPRKLLPVSLAYFDDTLGHPRRIGSLLRNRWAGQLRAIDEFNADNQYRKLDVIRTLKYRRPLYMEQWLEQVYGVHVLDHPSRGVPDTARPSMSMLGYRSATSSEWPI